jgi:SAM-dependent methyltransferase
LCNSVLEYVRPDQLAAIVGELRRVLKPGGRLLVTGTSSRLSPKEVHSGRWLVNYLPRRIDSWLGRCRQRGLDPFRLRRLVRDGFTDEDAPAAAASGRRRAPRCAAAARLRSRSARSRPWPAGSASAPGG